MRFMESVTETLKAGDAINFTGFQEVLARTPARCSHGRQPAQSGTERVHIAATTVPKFSAGSQLKAALKG